MADKTVYISLCFFFRVCASVATSCASTASFALTVETFNENAMTILGLLEISYGVGLSIGPAAGALLYEVRTVHRIQPDTH